MRLLYSNFFRKSPYRGRGIPSSHTLPPLGRFAPSPRRTSDKCAPFEVLPLQNSKCSGAPARLDLYFVFVFIYFPYKKTTKQEQYTKYALIQNNEIYSWIFRSVGHIRHYLTNEATKTLVHSFVTSRMDCNNSLLYGVTQRNLQKLQMLQNAAARLVTRALICYSQTIQLWGRVKSMDANVQVRSEMCA